jgi:hypothetical protein
MNVGLYVVPPPTSDLGVVFIDDCIMIPSEELLELEAWADLKNP